MKYSSVLPDLLLHCGWFPPGSDVLLSHLLSQDGWEREIGLSLEDCDSILKLKFSISLGSTCEHKPLQLYWVNLGALAWALAYAISGEPVLSDLNLLMRLWSPSTRLFRLIRRTLKLGVNNEYKWLGN